MNKDVHKKITALFTALVFAFSQPITLPSALAQDREFEVPAAPEGFQLDLPSDLGTVQNLISGKGPVLVHIQTAHGNYGAQKKIQAILHYLKDNYGISTLFVEGSASQLEPGLLNFFPDRKEVSVEIADNLAKKAVVKGSEIFLLEDPGAQAFGVEDLKSYIANGEAFRAVLTQQEKSEKFLADMDVQIERLSSPYLSKDLKEFLKRLDDYEIRKTIQLSEWITYLKGRASEVLKVDVSDPRYQIDWPMLLRILKLKEFESRIDSASYIKERGEFLKAIKGVPEDVYNRIEKLLTSSLSQNQLPDPETGLLFENMVEALPDNFDFSAYPNVKIFIGHLILQSELKADRLFSEISLLTDKISQKLAQTREEQKLLVLFKDHRLLKQLFSLELTPRDLEAILQRGEEARPKNLAAAFTQINDAKRVRDAEFTHVEEIDALYDRAVEFYDWARKRDKSMIDNIEKRMAQAGLNKAVVITGGFHAGPFKEHFQGQGYNYALISPRITSFEGHDAYVQAALMKGLNFISRFTWEDPLLEDPTLARSTQVTELLRTEVKTVATSFDIPQAEIDTAFQQALDRANRRSEVSTVRSETRVKMPKISPSVFYKGFRDRHRKLYAFVPADGKRSVVVKVGGKGIEAKTLLPNGTFSREPRGIIPQYRQDAPPGAGSKKLFDLIREKVDYTKFGGEDRFQAELKRYQDITVREMAKAGFSLIQDMMKEAGVDTTTADDILAFLKGIDVIGFTTPGIFDSNDPDAVFVFDSQNPPFRKGASMKKELINALMAIFTSTYASLGTAYDFEELLDGKVRVVRDVEASGMAEVGPHGTVPGGKNILYVSLAEERIAGSIIQNGKPVSGGLPLRHAVGEIGSHMVWFPETQSYGWVAPATKGESAETYPGFKGYMTANQRLSANSLASYFTHDKLSQLSTDDFIEAGLEIGRMIGAYLKAIRAEMEVQPDSVVIGSVVGSLQEFHPYIMEAIEAGIDQELNRPIETEIGFRDGLIQKHKDIIAEYNPGDSAFTSLPKFLEAELEKRFGKLYAAHYMRAFEINGEDSNRGRAAKAQEKQIRDARKDRQEIIDDLDAINPSIGVGPDQPFQQQAIKFIKRRRYKEAVETIQKAIDAIKEAGILTRNDDIDEYEKLKKKVEVLWHGQIEVVYFDGKTMEQKVFKKETDYHNWPTAKLKGDYKQWLALVEGVNYIYSVQNPYGKDRGGDLAKEARGVLLPGADFAVQMRGRGIGTEKFEADQTEIEPEKINEPVAFTGPFLGLYHEHDRITGKAKRKLGYTGFGKFLIAVLKAIVKLRGLTTKGNIVVLSGGSGAPGLLTPILTSVPGKTINKLGLFFMSNTDDGGSSAKIIHLYVKKGAGVYPALGDPAQALVKFLPTEFFAGILDDGGGRIRATEPKDSEFMDTTRQPTWTLEQFLEDRLQRARIRLHYDNVAHVAYDKDKHAKFEAFAELLRRWIKLAQEELLTGTERLKMEDISFRNAMAIGAIKEWANEHADSNLLKVRFGKGEKINALETEKDQADFHAAWLYIAEKLNIEEGRAAFATTDAATLFAAYEENVIRFQEKGVERILAVRVGTDKDGANKGKVIVREPRNPRAEIVVLDAGQSRTFYGISVQNHNFKGEPRIAISNGADARFIQEEQYDALNGTYNKTYLAKLDGSERIELGNDGFGVPKNAKNKKEDATQIGGLPIFVTTRLIITQDRITQTANHSRITNLGALNFGSESTLGNGKVLKANPAALASLKDENNLAIVMGPGSLPTSLLPHLLSKEIVETLLALRKEGKVKLLYIFNPNLDNETMGMEIEAMMKFIEDVANRTLQRTDIKFQDLFDIAAINDGIDPDFTKGLEEFVDARLETKTAPKSEVRFVAPEVKTVFAGPRDRTLPLRFEELGTDYLVQTLTILLGTDIISERANVLPAAPSRIITETLGQGLVNTTPAFAPWMENTASDKGRVLFEASGLLSWAKESPRGLYILLSALQNYQASRPEVEPLIGVVTPDGKNLLKELSQILTNGKARATLKVEERTKIQTALIPELGKILSFIAPDKAQAYVDKHDYGVATMSLPGSQWPSGFAIEADFSFDQAIEGEGVAFVVPALLKMASVIRGIKDVNGQRSELRRYLQDILPGSSPKPGGGYTVTFAAYFQNVMLRQRLVDVAA